MQVKRDLAVELLKRFGYLTATNWDDAKILSKLNQPKIAEIADVDPLPDMTDEQKSLLESLLLNKEEVTLAAATDESGKETDMSKKNKPKKEVKEKKAKAPKEAKPKKEKSQKDAFGYRVGTLSAQRNAALSKTPKTMKELMEASKSETTFYSHLKRLTEKGLVVKDGDKFRLA